jgi:trehalose 6-phosphate synthase
MLALAYPSREGLADYLAYRAEVEHATELVNARWGTGDWQPVLLDVADDRARSLAALRRYDVLLVNPVRDGMNLVAQEGPLVNDLDGVVVLSREAGAFDELAGAVVGINPFDVSGTAEALHQALELDPAERSARATELRRRVAANPAALWFDRQLAAASRPVEPVGRLGPVRG